MDLTHLKQLFFEEYGSSTEQLHTFFSPGRVNLIGEHTDYNGGYVFPCALTFGTYLIVRLNSDGLLRFATTNFKYRSALPVAEPFNKKGDKWINYPLGVISELQKRGFQPGGLDMLFSGDIPNSAGLSSSASIELVTGVAMNDLFQLGYERIDLVKIGQIAEILFVGVNCGIMDQFAVGWGMKDHALYLKCDTLDYELVPIKMDGYKLVISNTNKSRGLADSKYNERVAECRQAVNDLSAGTPIGCLADMNGHQFAEYAHLISSETIKKRARHVISENERVHQAVKALKDEDMKAFGMLMNQSHDSLRDDYAVTGIELDTLVEESRKVDGVVGSRMTGAGFGGCTVSLVKEESVDTMIRLVGPAYKKHTGLKADFYIADIGDGAKRIGDR